MRIAQHHIITVFVGYPVLLFVLISLPLSNSSGTGVIRQWIKERLLCGGHDRDGHQPKSTTRIQPDSPSFGLRMRDRDFFFRDHLRPPLVVLCDTFSDWRGYSLSDIQERTRRLTITEQSDWLRWDQEDTWVFLGYRGTNQQWATKAAESGYEINPKGSKYFGDGIYMTPRRVISLYYAQLFNNQPHGRICYNFAPRRILSRLLMCAAATSATEDHDPSVAYMSSQRIKKAPRQVSARWEAVYPQCQRMRSSVVVYPRPIVPFIRVICIAAPENRHFIPDLFEYNSLVYKQDEAKMSLSIDIPDVVET